MHSHPLPSLGFALLAITATDPVSAQQQTKPLPDAEIVGLESVTEKTFSDIVQEKCGGKY